MKRIHIGIVTGSRADYGLLYWLIKECHDDPQFELQLYVTGMHLSPEFGYTVSEIEKDGFPITAQIETILSSDTAIGISKSIALGISSFSEALEARKPDLLVVLGDRTEIFAAAIAAHIAGIPIGHIHGGEITLGAYDDAIRHSLTKMGMLHFASTDAYRQRIIQMGEHPDRVFNVGAPGVEYIHRMNLLPQDEVEKRLHFRFRQNNFLVIYHPVTLENRSSEKQFSELLDALNEYPDTGILFTYPNSDKHGRIIIWKINDFLKKRKNAIAVPSMGTILYLSALSRVDGIIGNSSSGIIEAPSLQTGTINIGERQRGRIFATSVIQSDPDKDSICRSIDRMLSDSYRVSLPKVENPYDAGMTSERIIKILKSILPFRHLKKGFFDLPDITQ